MTIGRHTSFKGSFSNGCFCIFNDTSHKKSISLFSCSPQCKCSVYVVDSEAMVVLFYLLIVPSVVRTWFDWGWHHPPYPSFCWSLAWPYLVTTCYATRFSDGPGWVINKTRLTEILHYCILSYWCQYMLWTQHMFGATPMPLWCDKRSVNDPQNVCEDLNCSLSFWSCCISLLSPSILNLLSWCSKAPEGEGDS